MSAVSVSLSDATACLMSRAMFTLNLREPGQRNELSRVLTDVSLVAGASRLDTLAKGCSSCICEIWGHDMHGYVCTFGRIAFETHCRIEDLGMSMIKSPPSFAVKWHFLVPRPT